MISTRSTEKQTLLKASHRLSFSFRFCLQHKENQKLLRWISTQLTFMLSLSLSCPLSSLFYVLLSPSHWAWPPEGGISDRQAGVSVLISYCHLDVWVSRLLTPHPQCHSPDELPAPLRPSLLPPSLPWLSLIPASPSCPCGSACRLTEPINHRGKAGQEGSSGQSANTAPALAAGILRFA